MSTGSAWARLRRGLLAAGAVCACLACAAAEEWPARSPGGNSLRYRFTGVPGGAGAPALTDDRQDLRLVVSTSARGSWSIHERFGHFGVNPPVQLPQAGLAVPRSLWSLEGGLRYEQRLDADRGCRLAVSLGSDSDRLFHSSHETVVQVAADYRVPSRGRNAWLFSLSYSNNRYFLNGAPMPGISYMFRSESGRLRGVVGFPFAALSYTPAPSWDIWLSAFGPRRLSLEAGRRLDKTVRVNAGFEWGGQTWLRAGRADNASRLAFERKRLYAGVEAPLPQRISLTICGGREFDRRFSETTSAFSTGGAATTLPPAWFAETAVAWRWGADEFRKSATPTDL